MNKISYIMVFTTTKILAYAVMIFSMIMSVVTLDAGKFEPFIYASVALMLGKGGIDAWQGMKKKNEE